MSQLRLTGSGGGNTILEGNDTITTDQTFEFPDNGGTLATQATGVNSPAGSAQAVGIQTGTFTAHYISGDGTLTYTDHATVENQSFWYRMGALVFVNVWAASNGVIATRPNSNCRLPLPYRVSAGPGSVASSLRASMLNTSFNTANVTQPLFVLQQGQAYGFFVRPNAGGTQSPGSLNCDEFFRNAGSGRNNEVRIGFTYRTDDTTWTPSIGTAD